MTDILSEIIAHKRIEIELQKQAVSLERLQEEVAAMMQKDATAGTSVAIPVRSMKQALASSPTGIIAEFKRRSPSKGWIHETARAEEIPAAYETAGASAVSILTDEKILWRFAAGYTHGTPTDRHSYLAKGFHHRRIPIAPGTYRRS